MDQLKSVLLRQGNRSRLYRQVFGTPDGERVLADICKMAHIGHSTFIKGDPARTTMNEGARNLALIVLQLAKIDPQRMSERLQQPENDDI